MDEKKKPKKAITRNYSEALEDFEYSEWKNNQVAPARLPGDLQRPDWERSAIPPIGTEEHEKLQTGWTEYVLPRWEVWGKKTEVAVRRWEAWDPSWIRKN